MTRFAPDIEQLLGNTPPPSHAVTVYGPREMSQLGGAYEGAGRFDRELALWSPALQSVDNDVHEAKDLTDARVRDLLRNDGMVQHGGTLHKDNIVGSYYALNARPEIAMLGKDEKWQTAFQEEVETKWAIYAESSNCWLDAQRVNTFTEMVRLAVGVYLASGEVLATAEWIRDDPLRPFKTALQFVDIDRLSNPYGVIDFGPPSNIRRGIERDKRGAPVAYHIRMGHPTDFSNVNSYLWKRVPRQTKWGRLQVLHIYESMRPDQTRGISDMVAVLKETRMGRRYRDLKLQSAAIQATYAASIESELPPEAVYQALGAGNLGTNDMGEMITSYATAYLSAIAAYTGSSKNIAIDGVKIPHLFPGTKLQLRPAGAPGDGNTGFEASLLRHLAANLGVSYEELSKDFTQTNYSSFKGGMNETRKFMASRKKLTADRFANAGYALWFEEQMAAGELDCMSGQEEDFYQPGHKEAYTAADWIGASTGQIDELKETQAANQRVAGLFTTHEDELGRLGKDWRKVFRQIKRERDLMKELDIEPIQTNAMNAASGDAREPAAEPKGGGPKAEEPELPFYTALVDRVMEGQERITASLGKALARPQPVPATQEPQPPANVSVTLPDIHIDVHAHKQGKTVTKVLAHDEKGRILKTTTEPVEDD